MLWALVNVCVHVGVVGPLVMVYALWLVVTICGWLSGCCCGHLWGVGGWLWSWWSWAVVVLCACCLVVIVACVIVCIHGQSLFAVGDCGEQLSLFIVIAISSGCCLCVLLVVVREREANK